MSERKEAIRKHMQQQHQMSWSILQRLSEGDMERTVYSEGGAGWSIHQLLGHLADSERGNLGQVKRLVAGEVTVPEDFDLDRWNRSAVRKREGVPFRELLRDIEAAFAEALAYLESIDESALDLRGRHARGDIISAEAFFLRMADHRAEHAADIQGSLTG